MEKVFKRPFVVFAIFASILAAIFFLFPINLFDGEIVVDRGLQKFTADQQLSLSNFIGIGTEGMKEFGIVDFYLKPQGYIIAFIMILGMPAIIAYRLYLKVNNNNSED